MIDRETRYRVGDYIEYEYGGSFCPIPVFIKEEVIEQHGNELTIKLHARRGGEEKCWIQVVIDTPENQKNKVVEELYEIVDEKKKYLKNENNVDLYRLYEWVIPPTGKNLSKTSYIDRSIKLSSEYEISATCSTNKQSIQGRVVDAEYCVSSEFIWTNVSAKITDADSKRLLYFMKVVRWGNKANR